MTPAIKKTINLLQKHFDTALESPDGIKKLRELILTLAMQGKLVPQDTNDPPASELLKEIQAEKEGLIAEGKIKKQKVLPEIKPEEVPYEVPEGWVWTRLGNAGQFERGISKHRPRNDVKLFKKGKYPLIQTGNVAQSKNTNNIITTCGSYYNYFGLAQSRLWLKGTLCITIAANIAETGFLGIDACFPDSVVAYLSIAGVSSRYIKCFIDIAKKKLEHFAPSTAQKNINLGIINNLVFPLPPLAEQKRIVARIDELMALCDKLEEQRASRDQKRLAAHTAAIHRLLTAADKNEFHSSWQFITRHFDPIYSVKENVAELKKAILTLAMQGKLVPQDPNDPPASDLLKEIQAEKERLIAEGKIKKQKALPEIKPEDVPYEVPEGWVWVNLRHVTHDWGQKKPDQTFTYIDVGSIDNSKGIISEEPQVVLPINAPSRARKIVTIGTVIYSTVRPYLLNIAIVEKKYLYEPIASTAFAVMHPYHGMDVRFLYLYLNCNIFIRYVENKQKGVAYPAISDGDLFQGILPLPPLAEQKRIVARIDELMTLCDKLEHQIGQATAKQTALFDAVLAKV